MQNYLLILCLSFNLICVKIKGAPSIDNVSIASSLSNLTETAIDEVPIKYDGAQLWRVSSNDEGAKQTILDLQERFDVTTWNINGSSVDLFLKKSAIDGGVGDILDSANVRYSIIIENMQKEIDAENPQQDEIEQLQDRKAKFDRMWRDYNMPERISKDRYLRLKGAYLGRNSFDSSMEYWPVARWGHRLTWSAYHRVGDIYNYLDYLATTYPDLCSLQTIGYSVEKRPLRVLRISNGNPKNKAIWMDGGIHAREWISPASVTYIVNNLVEEWEDQPEYIRNINWYVLPVLNPDGYEFTHRSDRLWRKNRSNGSNRCPGVDLNRNYGFHWGEKGTSQRPCSEIYAGPKAFSEPETLAQMRFFEKTKENFKAFLTFHSYGQYILYPWGYDTFVPPDYQDLERVGKNGAANMKAIDQQIYSVGPSGSLLYPAAGASDDWAKSIGIKYSYTVELRDKGRYGFVLPAYLIQQTAKEAEAFVMSVARAVAELKRQ